MQIVPLNALPNQTLTVGLNGQSCQIDVFSKGGFVFLSLYLDDDPVILGVICLDRDLIVRDAYLGFDGDLAFVDTQGSADPVYTGLGTRFLLIYETASEILAGRS